MIYELVKNNDLEILDLSEDYFSPNINTETENPLLVRVVLKKKIIPYYEKSTNYNLYTHIVSKMNSNTHQSYKDMNIMNIILEKHNIKYVAVAGTILGLNRHGGIIPWDNDIDIGFIDTEWDKLLKIKKELEENGLSHYENNSNNHCHFGKIDCFRLLLNNNYYTGVAKTYCHVNEYKQISKQIFGYTYIYAPFCSIKSLSFRYGKSYFTTGDVNDNFHYKDKHIPRFNLNPNDYSYQTNKSKYQKPVNHHQITKGGKGHKTKCRKGMCFL